MTETTPSLKFYPYYRLAFLTNGGSKDLSYFSFPRDLKDSSKFGDLACDITIAKNEQGLFSSLGLTIYNLNGQHRGSLFKEPYYITKDELENSFMRVALELGYLTETGKEPLKWVGDIRQSSSYKVGDNIATELVADQIGYIQDNCFIQLNINKGDKLSNVFEKKLSLFIKEADYTKHIQRLATTKTGQDITEFFLDAGLKIRTCFKKDYTFTKSKVLNDKFTNIVDYLRSYIPGSKKALIKNELWIYDDEKNLNKKTQSSILIDFSTGLQSTPRVYGQRITLTTLFEPYIDIADKVEVKSLILPKINGDYSVVGYTHRLTLGSGTRSQAITSLNLKRENIEG